ncbi:DEAD/DEAH box helicase [Paenibacillus sp. LMG 31456]|uniref:DEAD/DEAH box helicase n=1 Tax=Paenibacillus foliorum TaxID=2654974 RepID=A0A972K2M6_9BACL|nr:helicase-related protein [Paenibacillus foliorum]NOU95078.1 DEAD/DEAH box helicase [Paenibacillus foliorum]
MKVVLYSVRKDHTSSWHISLDIRADLIYWFGQHKDSLRIWMLEPSISYGQAVGLCEKLSLLEHSRELLPRPESLLRAITQQAAALGIPLTNGHGSDDPRIVECDLEQWEAYRMSQTNGLLRIEEDQLSVLIAGMQGRSLLMDEVTQLMEHYGLIGAATEPMAYVQTACLQGALHLNQGVLVQKLQRKLPFLRKETASKCHRCGGEDEQLVYTDCIFCGTACPYCEQCLTMGRSRYCAIMVSASLEPGMLSKSEAYYHDDLESKLSLSLDSYIQPWGLSEIQAEASLEALAFLKANDLQMAGANPVREQRRFLIWAVTGAGKTEMIFPLIQYTVAQGGKVVVATPRRDVVLELKPRLEKAFAPTPVVTLYGGSEQRWDSGTITIATTHQLLRFHHAFDLVIIDELDAFPYHNNPMLEYAAQKVCKTTGATVLLSATPPKHLQKAAKRRHLPHVKVAARFHRHPLPVPILMSSAPLAQQLKQSSLPIKLKHRMMTSLERGAQVFVFVPKIYMVEPLTQLLSRLFPEIVVQGTSSKDDNRTQKVGDFRNKQVRMLITTTILERGVTIPKSDVFILDADAPIFDSAALVQMAGRAGRSADDPAGSVFFVAKERTRAQVEATRQIKGMNALARKKGYLRTKEVTKS